MPAITLITGKVGDTKIRPIFFLLLSLLTLFFCQRAIAVEGASQKIGILSDAGQFEDARTLLIQASQPGTITIKIGGKQSYASSETPELWKVVGGFVYPVYRHIESHGLKARMTTSPKNDGSESEFHVYHDGQYWNVTHEQIKPVLRCADKSILAEIKDQAIWFDGRELAKLPEHGTPGTWYPKANLEITLADDFHNSLSIDLANSCACTLAPWVGRNLDLRMRNSSKISIEKLAVKQCSIGLDYGAVATIQSLTCNSMWANSGVSSSLLIAGGHSEYSAIHEIANGKVIAPVDGFRRSEKPSRVVRPPSQWFTPAGDFDLKVPDQS